MSIIRTSTIILFLGLSATSYAQSEADTTHVADTNPAVRQPIPVKEEVRIDTVKARIDSLNAVITRLDNDLKKKENQIDTLSDTNLTLQKRMGTMILNYIYMPYEKYVIEQVAVPGIPLITDPKTVEKAAPRFEILKNYAKDIMSMKQFVDSINMRKNANPFGRKEYFGKVAQNLKNTPTFKRYEAYSDWEQTYLGKIIAELYRKLMAVNQDKELDITDIKRRLNDLAESTK